MILLILILFLLFTLALVLLDTKRKINLMRVIPLTVFLFLFLNIILFAHLLLRVSPLYVSKVFEALFIIVAVLFLFYLWIRLNIFPVRVEKKLNIRLKIMISGRFLVFAGLWAMVIEILFLIFCYSGFFNIGIKGIQKSILIYNAVYGIAISFLLMLNGITRIFFTSKRLSIVRRLVILFTFWIPVVNLFLLLHICRIAYEEYDFACYKEDLHLTRVDSDICKTKYPLVMVHGVLFRDLKYFNYWGRIPKELIRYGAAVYYGNQEAAGTIVTNAEDLRKKILEITEETGCQKVNIIAHSKGGLDSRYAISMLNMEKYVASLTTICTPHYGCKFVDLTYKLPDIIYRLIAKIIDSIFSKLGDKNPDFYTTARQFSTHTSKDFNEKVKDSPLVYYQSYMAKMKNLFSDTILTFTYSIIKRLEGDNDGLVSAGSAVWGNFRGVFESKTRRGISHGDIIDLKRQDYKGFDVIEAYVQIVSELKEKGF